MDHTSICFRRQAGIKRHKRNTSHLPAHKWCGHQKVFPNNIKPAWRSQKAATSIYRTSSIDLHA